MNSNPALKISNYSKFSKKVFEELNFARTNPKLYAKKLSDIKANLKDNVLNLSGWGIYYTEGTAGFDEAIEFLKSYPNPGKLSLSWSQGIIKSAEEFLNILILHEGIEGMTDTEKSKYDLDKRMNHYGASFGELDELIDYGTFDPEYVVVNFIICDGDPERKERQIVFNPLIKYCGISAGILPSNKMCTVINLAEFFYSPGETVPQAILQKFTNLNLNQNLIQYVEEEIKTRKRNTSTKLYKEKEEKFKQKNNGKNSGGVINLDCSKNLKNDTQIKKDVNENLIKNINISSNIENKKENTEPKKEILNDKTIPTVKEEVVVTKKAVEKVEAESNKDDGLSLPENVDRINYVEKTVKDKLTGKDVVIVKKIVFYSDGNKDTSIYKK